MKRKIKLKTLQLFKNIPKILSPPPKLTVSEWADEYRMLSAESSAESGKWRTDRAPYQKGILDAASDAETETVVIMSSAQVGKTELINNTIGYYVDYDPAPIMVVMPTVDLAKTYSKKRLAPMIRDTPTLAEKIKDAKSKDSDNTILEKGFPGGYVALVGANSPVGLSSRPIRILLADEVDRFPASAGAEGDPLSLAEKRTKTFWNKKKIFVSTPTEKGISRIEKEFLNSTQEEWCILCPVCGKYQPFKWDQIKFKRIDPESNDVTDVLMECKFCKDQFTEFEWKANMLNGKWISQNTKATKRKRGFHLNALASPWERWDDIIEQFLEAKKDKETLKTWVNTFLGEVWEDQEGETLEHEVLLKRRETYNCQIPEEVLLLTAGVDVQDDRFEIEVVGWGKDKESWGIEYKKIYGNLEQSQIWNELDQYLASSFFYEDGNALNIACACMDTGGHFTNETYKFIKSREIRRIFGIKGMAGFERPVISKPSKSNREKINLFTIGVDVLKDRVYDRLKLHFEGPGYCHFPTEQKKGYDEEYFKTLCSEKKIIRYVKGAPKFQWIQKRKRNEGLDIRNYASAALEILNPNFEMLEKMKKSGKLHVSKDGNTVQNTQKKKRKMISKGL